jgi:pimeloyl-ACP methyl ester carboxylesterase
VRCLRADLSGIGDSPARPGRAELEPFPVDALDDIDDIRRAMTAEGAELILIGVCSGADHAIGTAFSAPVAGLCVINPAFTYGRPRSGEEATPANVREAWGGPGPTLSRAMALVAPYKRLTRWIPTPGLWMVKRWLMTGTMVRTFEHLAQTGVDILVVAGPLEVRRYRGEQHRLHALIARGRVHLEIVPDLDHSLLERSSHDRMAEVFGAYIARRAAELSGPGAAPPSP